MTLVEEVTHVESTLAEYSTVVRTEMQRWLPNSASADHLWALVRDYPNRPGKGIRPALLLATCQAFGGSLDDALRPAAALELLHNAFLVHDDVEDASRRRRGSPTLHELHGVPRAVNAGDALALVGLLPLRAADRLSSRVHRRVVDEFVRMGTLTVEGQALELGWRDELDETRTPEHYLELIMRKTCWYTTISPLRVGAIIGSGDRASLGELNRFGFYLGAAFQIRDDLLNLLDWTEAYGKERLGDLREGKRTLMLMHLASAVEGVDHTFLGGFLRRAPDDRDGESLEHVVELMVAYGSFEFAEAYGRGIADAALEAFESAFAMTPDSSPRRFVRGLVPYMLARRQ